MSRWCDQAQRIILPIVRRGLDERLDHAEIRKQVRAAYPWGERKYHPYKQWLKAQRAVFGWLGIESPGAQRANEQAIAELPLFQAMREQEGQ